MSWATSTFISYDASIAIVHALRRQRDGPPQGRTEATRSRITCDIQSLTAVPGGDLYASWYMTAPMLLRATPTRRWHRSTSRPRPRWVRSRASATAASCRHGIYPSGERSRNDAGESPVGEITSDALPGRTSCRSATSSPSAPSPKNKAIPGAVHLRRRAQQDRHLPAGHDQLCGSVAAGLERATAGRCRSSTTRQCTISVPAATARTPEQTEASAPGVRPEAEGDPVMTPFKEQRSITASPWAATAPYGTTACTLP